MDRKQIEDQIKKLQERLKSSEDLENKISSIIAELTEVLKLINQDEEEKMKGGLNDEQVDEAEREGYGELVPSLLDEPGGNNYAAPTIQVVNRALAKDLKVGQFVTWESNTFKRQGQIKRIVEDGGLTVPPTGMTVTGTKENPVCLIKVWIYAADRWVESFEEAMQLASQLEIIDLTNNDTNQLTLPKSLSIKEIAQKKGLRVQVTDDGLILKYLSHTLKAPLPPVAPGYVGGDEEEPGSKPPFDNLSNYPGGEGSYIPTQGQLSMINKGAVKPLEVNDLYVFELQGADDQYDRGYERFTTQALNTMAKMSPGKPVLMNHDWTTNTIVGKIFDAKNENGKLIQYAYFPKSQTNSPVVENILNGLYNMLSVGFAATPEDMVCDSCGHSIFDMDCKHQPGAPDSLGNPTTISYKDVKDYFEISIVAVPMQPAAHIRRDSEKSTNILNSILDETVKHFSNSHN